MTNVHNIGYNKEPFISKLPFSEKWIDSSWKNDVCDSIIILTNKGTFFVWFDYLNPEDREFPEAKQFRLSRVFNGHMTTLIETDDFDVIVSATEAWLPS